MTGRDPRETRTPRKDCDVAAVLRVLFTTATKGGRQARTPRRPSTRTDR